MRSKKIESVNTSLKDALDSINIKKESDMVDTVIAENVSVVEIVGVTEISVTPQLLEVGKVKQLTLSPVREKHSNPPKSKYKKDKMRFDEFMYKLIVAWECGPILASVKHKDTGVEIPVMIAKQANSKMFHVSGANEDKSKRLGYVFLGHPVSPVSSNTFHDIDWKMGTRPTDLIFVPRYPGTDQVCNNKIGLRHTPLAHRTTDAIRSWFNDRFDSFMKVPRVKSYNTVQQMFFKSLAFDSKWAIFHVVKNANESRVHIFRRDIDKTVKSFSVGMSNIEQYTIGHFALSQYKNEGVQARWFPTLDKVSKRPISAPTRHGEKGMSGLAKILIDGVINETITL